MIKYQNHWRFYDIVVMLLLHKFSFFNKMFEGMEGMIKKQIAGWMEKISKDSF